MVPIRALWDPLGLAEAGDDPFQVVSLAVDGQDQVHLVYSTVTTPSPLDGQVWYRMGSPRWGEPDGTILWGLTE